MEKADIFPSFAFVLSVGRLANGRGSTCCWTPNLQPSIKLVSTSTAGIVHPLHIPLSPDHNHAFGLIGVGICLTTARREDSSCSEHSRASFSHARRPAE